MNDVMSEEVHDVLAGLQHGTLKMVYARHERDKRLFYCTVKYADQPATLEQIKKAVADVFDAHPDKVEQVEARPFQIGWLVGQSMKLLHGAADPEVVLLECSQRLALL
jgi:hypothetical protein